MAGSRACLLLCFAAVGAAAPVSDESCLVQSRRDVSLQGRAALEPSMPRAHREFAAKLRAMAAQLPFELPGAAVGNVSMEQMMSFGMEFLSLLKNETIVKVMEEGMANLTRGLLHHSEHMTHAAQALRAAAKNASSKTEVLIAVSDYFMAQNTFIAKMGADVVVDPRRFSRMLPAGSLLGNMTQPMLQLTENMTKKQISGVILAVLTKTTRDLVANETEFCDKFEPLIGNLSETADFLATKSASMMDKMEGMLPEVAPMLEGFAPEVASKASALLNKTFESIDDIMSAYRTSLPISVSTLTGVAEDRLDCYYPAVGAEPSGAAPLAGARRGLAPAALLAAAAAWMSAA